MSYCKAVAIVALQIADILQHGFIFALVGDDGLTGCGAYPIMPLGVCCCAMGRGGGKFSRLECFMLNVATGTKWVLSNWKMNGRLASNQTLLAALLTDAQVNVAHVGLAVPTVYMAQVAQALSGQPMAWVGRRSAALPPIAPTPARSAPPCWLIWVRALPWWGIPNAASILLKAMRFVGQIRHAREAGLLPVVCVGEGWPRARRASTRRWWLRRSTA